MARRLYQNQMSFVGALITAIGLILVVASLGMQLSTSGASPYIGILTYLVFPGIINVGVLLVLIGMWRESRRRLKGLSEEPPYPSVNLNNRRHRRIVLWALPALAGGGLLLAFVAYNGFLFTESVTFCGRVCHTVMEPEYTAYLHSPHANVRCVECHVGPGAGWFVRSKLSGVHQVFAVLLDSYDRPIETPIENLRPARETCEHCHWPEKFFGAQLVENPHFRYDRTSTAEQITFAVKTGGGGPSTAGFDNGIHWHMVVSVDVEYALSDAGHHEFPWIKVTRLDGSTETYTDRATELTPTDIAELPRHTMDCIDCHNRPTHIYGAVDRVVDRALASHTLPRDLPWVKRASVALLSHDYASHEEAAEKLPEDLRAFYRVNEPEVLELSPGQLAQTAEALVTIYRQHVFPAMGVAWGTYTDNIGHRNWPGCFRCHDGRHVDTSGLVLANDCTICHTNPERSALKPLGSSLPEGDDTWHLMSLEGGHGKLMCNTCHSAGRGEPPTCAECHQIPTDPPMMSDLACDDCHAKPGLVQPLTDCTTCHPDPLGLHNLASHAELDCWSCHTAHRWDAASREPCLVCHDDRRDHMVDEGPCAGCHDFRT